MTESDELLSKADALLARWRSGAKAPEPPLDYPVLTEAIEGPEAIENPAEPEVPALDSPARASTELAPIEADLPPLPPLEATPGARAADIDVRGLEERVRLRVLEAIEPRIAAFLDGVARRCTAEIAKNARDDILAVVYEAVRSALAQELASRRDERDGRGGR